MRDTDNFKKFSSIYREELNKSMLLQSHREAIADIVISSIKTHGVRPTVSMQGNAMKATCKRLGIKCTHKALNMFLTGHTPKTL